MSEVNLKKRVKNISFQQKIYEKMKNVENSDKNIKIDFLQNIGPKNILV